MRIKSVTVVIWSLNSASDMAFVEFRVQNVKVNKGRACVPAFSVSGDQQRERKGQKR